MKHILCILLLMCTALAQTGTVINGSRKLAGGTWDAGEAAKTIPFKTGTALPAGCTTGELFFKSDAAAGQQLHTCNSGTWTQVSSGGSGGSNAPFSEPCVSTDTVICIEEHFLSGEHVTGRVGELGWRMLMASPTGNQHILQTANQTKAVGIWNLYTSATAGNVALMTPPYAFHSQFTNGFMFENTWRIATAAVANSGIRVGISCSNNDISAAVPNAGVFFELDSTLNSSSTNWFGVARNSGTRNAVDMEVAPNGWDQEFQAVKIRRVDATTFAFSINGGTEKTATITLPSQGCGSFVQAINHNGAGKGLVIDRYRLKVTLE